MFDGRLPPLSSWLAQFAVPSILAIGATYAMLRLSQRKALRQPIVRRVAVPVLSSTGRLTLCSIGLAAAILLGASAPGFRLGLPTALAGALTAFLVLLSHLQAPWNLLKNISWSVLPLVAGLFVLVEGLARTGVTRELSETIQAASEHPLTVTTWAAGGITAIACNLLNNLPVGLIVGSAATAGPLSPPFAGALLIGVDLGPNLSVTGSLATILWLAALRREGINIGAWRFLRTGALVTAPSLLFALAGLLAGHA